MAPKRKREASEGPPPAVPPAPGQDGVQRFRKAIQDLKTKSQSKINSMTALADSLHEIAGGVSQVIADELRSAPVARIQPLVSVVDSILKKVGRDYKTSLAEKLPDIFRAVQVKAEDQLQNWLQKMVSESWRKHELLPSDVLDQLDLIFSPQPAIKVPPEGDMAPQAYPAAPQWIPGPPPPSYPAAASLPRAQVTAAMAAAVQASTQGAASKAQSKAPPAESPEVVRRRLAILTKIMEKKQPEQEELQEITKVPEIRKALALQSKGQKQEAMALLQQFKQELERKRSEHQEAALPGSADARRAAGARPADPRQSGDRKADSKAVDPRQPAKAPRREARPADAMAVEEKPEEVLDPRRAADEAAKKQDARLKRLSGEATLTGVEAMSEEEDEDEVGVDRRMPAKQILQGLPSIGFSEAWLRQCLSQMPSNSTPDAQRSEAPLVGRKVMGASGEQMVYVDELSPNEILLLLQLIFMLEERLRQSGRGLDLAQRVPHTFAYLQVDAAVDVMLKRLFDELPFQCSTTGLRFPTRERLKKHTDILLKRRAAQQQRQRGMESRGWMESIPDWVGNRDLVVGPALFRLGVAEEPSKASETLPGLHQDGEDSEAGPKRWTCPLDERRSVCPISGEPLDRIWSHALNDWAFSDVVAVELGASKPARFLPDAHHHLSESALLLKKSCFFSTPPSRRQEAIEECQSLHGAAAPASRPATKQPEDPELLALATKPPPRSFF